MQTDVEKQIDVDGFCQFIGMSLDEIQKMRVEPMTHDWVPRVLQIPRIRLLGMDVEFAEITEPRVLSTKHIDS